MQALPKSLEPEDVSSQLLAPLFSYVIVDPLAYKEGFDILKNKLLDLTIRMAKTHTQFYKSLPDDTCWEEKDLDKIQPITKDDLYQHREAIISTITTFGFITFTTGTTSQYPLLIERSQEEQLYLQNFFSILQAGALATKKLSPLGIVEGSMNHGSVLRLPGSGYNFMIELIKDYGIIRTAWLLQQEYNFNGIEKKVSQLQTTVMGLCYLKQYLEEQEIHLPKGQLKSITVFGWPIPKNRRDDLENYFGTQVNDNYSMSEMFGGARYCHQCQAYHFDPFVVHELVDLETQLRKEEGTGELVLTPLFPFSQRFVLIRYRSGDLIHVRKVTCKKGTKAYTFRGRLKRCVKIAPQIYLGEAEFAMAIDEFTDINRADAIFKVLKDKKKNNWPLFKMAFDRTTNILNIDIALIYDPIEHPEKANQLRQNILKKITNELPSSLTNWMAQHPKSFQLTFQPPATFEERDYWNL